MKDAARKVSILTRKRPNIRKSWQIKKRKKKLSVRKKKAEKKKAEKRKTEIFE